jgi:ATP-dependent Clp protease ATP-binding subunit ClpC
MWQRFTEKARRVVLHAQNEAHQANSAQVDTEHLLIGLLCEDDGAGAQILQKLGVTLEQVRPEIARTGKAEGQPESEPKPVLTPLEIEALRTQFQIDTALIRQLEIQLLRKLRGQAEKVDLKLSAQGKRILELAADEARRMRHDYIGTEHLLLALLRKDEDHAAQVLQTLGVSLEQARGAVIEHLQA